MEWLKDKKNLPIVVALAAFVFLAAGGLIAFELGAFSGGGSAPTVVATGSGAPGSYPGGAPGSYPGGAPGGYPGGAPGGYPGGMPGGPFGGGGPTATSTAPAVGAAAAAGAKTAAINPMVGADPFALHGGHKPLVGAAALKVASAMRPRMREILPPLTLFTLRPPRPEAASNFTLPGGIDQLLASTRVSGIVNAADGIFAVVEVNGAPQPPVKPGDSLPDGRKVVSIQSTGVTLRTPGGGTITVPLSNGPPEQSQPNPYGGFGGGYPGGGYPGGFGGGYPGGGYPGGFGGGYPGGGYPGGFGGGGGYPGGFGGGGGYPGGGGQDGGGGYPQ